jgi:signal transduction histidine kinase
MNFDLRTIIWMDAVLYLFLHGAIWFGLGSHRQKTVAIWCLSGMLSAVGLAFIGSRGLFPEWAVSVVGQLMMAAGNFGRQFSMRALIEKPTRDYMVRMGLFNAFYMALVILLFATNASDQAMMLVFFGFYTFSCWDYFLIGRQIRRRALGKSHKVVMASGLVFSVSLGIKTLALLFGVASPGLYDMGWDQAIVFVGQFVAISLVNVGFIQVVIEQIHQGKREAEQKWAREQERRRMQEKHREDLTALLNEREEIIRQLTLSNKSAGMGALVASIAHELNQPLAATLLHAELMGSHLKEAELDKSMLQDISKFIVQDTQRAGDIIRKLRNLFRTGKGEFQRMDFKQLVVDVLAMTQARMQNQKIEVTTRFANFFDLTGDATQLQQVVLNLVNNAIDALGSVQTRPRQLTLHGETVEGFLLLSVIDNGPGIPLENQEHVFSLFKTSKFDGMGVGLWLSQSIVESHGGSLSFTSEPGQGCTFSLKLPSTDYEYMR